MKTDTASDRDPILDRARCTFQYAATPSPSFPKNSFYSDWLVVTAHHHVFS